MTYLRALSAFLALCLAAIFAGLAAMPAQADNTRVSITDFRWSKDPQVDLGESVTWDWIGPDTMHSVTGQAPNATQWDSDPTISMPQHALGDKYTVTFDQPGTYLFVCKMHSSVRGTVTVSNTPGDPNSDPGPQPALNIDFEAPQVDSIELAHSVLGPKGKGTGLSFEVGEPGIASIDYYQLVKRGKGKRAKIIKRYRGYSESEVHVGINHASFAKRSATFKPVPGNYVAYFRVDDLTSNSSPTFTLPFKIVGPKKKKR